MIVYMISSSYSNVGSQYDLIWGLQSTQVAKHAGIQEQYGLKKKVKAVSGVRILTKLDMKLNDALPTIEVDPETYTVTADGEILKCDSASSLPLSRNYFLF